MSPNEIAQELNRLEWLGFNTWTPAQAYGKTVIAISQTNGNRLFRWMPLQHAAQMVWNAKAKKCVESNCRVSQSNRDAEFDEHYCGK
jgi:hypothetical protein